ncbi:hypothetical protein V1514DRAFT_338015 [Lipomyces japonicus]|uniref:uncharacterized protein n=1 Tax=Lipomyces japonicus TaxID=56871 RepID=UPI0034CFA366
MEASHRAEISLAMPQTKVRYMTCGTLSWMFGHVFNVIVSVMAIIVFATGPDATTANLTDGADDASSGIGSKAGAFILLACSCALCKIHCDFFLLKSTISNIAYFFFFFLFYLACLYLNPTTEYRNLCIIDLTLCVLQITFFATTSRLRFYKDCTPLEPVQCHHVQLSLILMSAVAGFWACHFLRNVRLFIICQRIDNKFHDSNGNNTTRQLEHDSNVSQQVVVPSTQPWRTPISEFIHSCLDRLRKRAASASADDQTNTESASPQTPNTNLSHQYRRRHDTVSVPADISVVQTQELQETSEVGNILATSDSSSEDILPAYPSATYQSNWKTLSNSV